MELYLRKNQALHTKLLLGKETIVFWLKTSLKLDLGGLFASKILKLT